MKHHPYRLIFCLVIVVGSACFALFTAQLLQPAAVLPHFNLPHIALLCLLSLTLSHTLAPDPLPRLLPTALLAAAVFGLLPLCARLVSADFALRIALAGGMMMLVTTFLFTSAADRLRSAPCAKAALPTTAFLLFLAVQAFTSVWL